MLRFKRAVIGIGTGWDAVGCAVLSPGLEAGRFAAAPLPPAG